MCLWMNAILKGFVAKRDKILTFGILIRYYLWLPLYIYLIHKENLVMLSVEIDKIYIFHV